MVCSLREKASRSFEGTDHVPFHDLGSGFTGIYYKLVIKLYIYVIIIYAYVIYVILNNFLKEKDFIRIERQFLV